jgi:hypothetical protein
MGLSSSLGKPTRAIALRDFSQALLRLARSRPHLPDEPERWRLEARAGSGFWQRYDRASFDGGRTIKGAWEGSAAGSQ